LGFPAFGALPAFDAPAAKSRGLFWSVATPASVSINLTGDSVVAPHTRAPRADEQAHRAPTPARNVGTPEGLGFPAFGAMPALDAAAIAAIAARFVKPAAAPTVPRMTFASEIVSDLEDALAERAPKRDYGDPVSRGFPAFGALPAR
jgi:hypothetical protein